MNRYLYRIQELQVEDSHSLFFLQSTLFETTLLPNLRVLKWNQQRNGTLMYIKPLVCPSLTVLDIIAYEIDEKALSSLFRTLPSICPGLKTINFSTDSPYYKDFKDPLSQALCSINDLKCLTIHTAVEDIAMEHILMSPKLEELTLATNPNQLAEFIPTPSDTVIPLRNVKKLDLWLAELSFITKFLRPDHQKFDDMAIHLHKLELPPVIGFFFDRLASQTDKSPLQSLRIDSRELDPRRDVAPYALTLDVFRPLAFLRNLWKLSIQIENPISVSDEELAGIARGWRSLEVLDLCCIRRSPAKWITLNGLLLLAAACPKLREIALTLDAREVPTKVGVPEGSQFDTVTAVSFPNSPIEDTTAVGQLLVAYFPSLTSDGKWRTFRWGQAWGGDRDAPQWGGVWKHIDEDTRSDAEDGDSDDIYGSF